MVQAMPDAQRAPAVAHNAINETFERLRAVGRLT